MLDLYFELKLPSMAVDTIPEVVFRGRERFSNAHTIPHNGLLDPSSPKDEVTETKGC